MSLQSFLQQNKKIYIYIYMYSETFSQYCCNNKNIYTCSNTSAHIPFKHFMRAKIDCEFFLLFLWGFFLTLENFSFAYPDFFFKSFDLDISLPLLDYTASFVTQKKNIPTLSPKLPFQLFICKKKLILILSSIYFLILC